MTREKVGVDLGLSPEEKKALREVAVSAIRSRCMNEAMPELREIPPGLREPRGAFVCLHKGGRLRGCIGLIEARYPLVETIGSMAVEAAFGDPRFPAVEPDELDKLDIEISVLTPLQRIGDPAEVQVGRHGLYIKRGRYSGLLLPQVAVERRWSREEFLENTCEKAGLPADSWKLAGTEIYVFSADIF